MCCVLIVEFSKFKFLSLLNWLSGIVAHVENMAHIAAVAAWFGRLTEMRFHQLVVAQPVVANVWPGVAVAQIAVLEAWLAVVEAQLSVVGAQLIMVGAWPAVVVAQLPVVVAQLLVVGAWPGVASV